MDKLREIFDKYKGIPKTFIDGMPAEWGGDKGTAHSYIETYEMLFRDIREKELKILEIGVLYGSSVKMWQDYFPNSIIYGIDVLEICKKYEDERIKIDIVDSTNPEKIKEVFKDLKFNIIIDDGHHDFDMQEKTFNTIFEYLEDGGIYIIEDIQNIDSTADKFRAFYKNVEILDLRYVKRKYDDVLVVIRK